MKWTKESDIYRRLANEALVETDARSSLLRIAEILDSDSTLSTAAFAYHAFFFLTETLSPAQTVLLRHLDKFSGDVLRDTYKHAQSHSKSFDYDDLDYSYKLEQINRVAHTTRSGRVNMAQLASALTFFNLTISLPDEADTTPANIEQGARFEYTEGNSFWFERGVSEDEVVELALDLARFEGSQVLTPKEITDRFRLCISVSEQGFAVFPTERWGVHSIVDPNATSLQRELILPEHSLAQPDDLREFEELLLSKRASEYDWQVFLENHPVFLYLLGDYEDHRREVALTPQLMLDETPGLGLRPDFLLRRMDMNLWDVLEIKLPTVRLVTGTPTRRRLTAPVVSALAQIASYSEFFSDRSNLRWFRKTHGIDVASPRLNLLIGRDDSFRDQREKSRFARAENATIFTYDDLYRIAKHRSLRTET